MASHTSRKQVAFAIGNAVAFLVMIATNMVAVLLPLNGKSTGELSDLYPNLFTPAGFTFSIWSLIYLSLLAFVVYQFVVLLKNQSSAAKIAAISPWFILNCFANAAWLFTWHYEMVAVSVLIMFLMLATLIMIHVRLNLALPWRPIKEKLLLDVPFSLYLGWISIATIANVTALLVDKGIQPVSPNEETWTIIMICVGTAITLFMLLERNNYVFALVVCWAFYGIIGARKAEGTQGVESIILAAKICMAVIILFMLVAYFMDRKQTKKG